MQPPKHAPIGSKFFENMWKGPQLCLDVFFFISYQQSLNITSKKLIFLVLELIVLILNTYFLTLMYSNCHEILQGVSARH